MATSAAASPYDEHLLNAAPRPDKKQLQEGYDADILNKPEKKPSAPTAKSSTPAPGSSTPGHASPTRERDLERAAPSRASSAPILVTSTKKKPFYKTPKGLIIIGAVVVAIIIAAVVGGVVGSRNGKKDGAVASGADNPAQTSSAVTTQGAGMDPPAPTASQNDNGQGAGAAPGGASTPVVPITVPTETPAPAGQAERGRDTGRR